MLGRAAKPQLFPGEALHPSFFPPRPILPPDSCLTLGCFSSEESREQSGMQQMESVATYPGHLSKAGVAVPTWS